MTAPIATVGMSEAKTNFSKLTASANATGIPITVFKNNKPWVEIRPLATESYDFASLPKETQEAIAETEAILADLNHTTYKTAQELFDTLELQVQPMYESSFSPRFDRDVKECKKKHWNMKALNAAMIDLLNSDSMALSTRYKDHALIEDLKGYRSLHVDSAPNPPKDQWVLMYKIEGNEIVFAPTGTHDQVYGKQKSMQSKCDFVRQYASVIAINFNDAV